MTDSSTRRRRLSPEERQQQMVAAAVEVVAERGYRGATADAIVARAGVSKGLLWRYFSDIDALMAHAARRTVMAIAEDAGANLDMNQPAPEVIRAAIHRAAGLLRTHRRERAALQQIIANLRGVDGSPQLTLHDYEELYCAQEALFRRGQDEGDFRRGLDPRLLAVTYQGAVDAMLDYLETHPEVDPAGYASTVAEVLLGGISESGVD